jgi:hypothetical protein
MKEDSKGFIGELIQVFVHLFYALIALPMLLSGLFKVILKGMRAKPQIALLVMVVLIGVDHLIMIGKYTVASTSSSRELVLQDSLSRYKESCSAQLQELARLKEKPVVIPKRIVHKKHKKHVELRDSII